ncbi:MAG: 16S rRNA (cytidine(1402)-2'-O)-methyltransferase [Pseudomonadota bacterium]
MSEKIVYVVATPIGNIEDISQRARRILESVDIIAAEDTRHTLKLLHLAKISPKKLVSYHDHNEEFRSEELVERILKENLSVALVSDAGTPCISDPGYRFVALARQKGIKVSPIAGPSAAVALASVAGLPVNRFLFMGFLPTRESQREKEIRGWHESLGSVIFYDSPRRLLSTLGIIHRIWPDSILAVGRELTKFHEEVIQGNISEVLAWAQGKPEILGEIVVMISGFQSSESDAETQLSKVEAQAREGFLAGKSLKLLQKELGQSGLDRNRLYELLLKVKKEV